MTWTDQSTTQTGWATPLSHMTVVYDSSMRYDEASSTYDGYYNPSPLAWDTGTTTSSGWVAQTETTATWTTPSTPQSGWQEN